MRNSDETALVQGARNGESASCEQLFERYQSRIYNYAYGICGNPDDAQDITQDAFIKVFEALPRVEGDVNFSAYLYRTAHNVSIDTVKAGSRFVAPEALDLQLDKNVTADPERTALLAEQQEQVRRAAFDLPDDYRAVLALRELEGLSYAQIGEVLDMPKNTVGVLLSRARLKFKGAYRMSQVDVDKLTQECRKMLPLLSAYVDDELTPGERLGVEAHLEDCAFCRLALEEMTEASESYRGLIPLVPIAGMKGNVLSRLAELRTMPDGTVSDALTAEREQVALRLTSGQKGMLGAAAIVVGGGALLGLMAGVGIVKAGSGSQRPVAIEKLCAGELREDVLLALPRLGEKASKEAEARGQESSGDQPPASSSSSPGSSGEASSAASPDGDGSTLGDQPGDTNLPDPVPPEPPPEPPPDSPY